MCVRAEFTAVNGDHMLKLALYGTSPTDIDISQRKSNIRFTDWGNATIVSLDLFHTAFVRSFKTGFCSAAR